MKIGINLTGVSYEDGSIYRYRNYEDAINSFFEFIVNPLKKEGHDVKFYIYTYETEKKEAIKKSYQPLAKATFIDQKTQVLLKGLTVQNHNLLCGFEEMVDEDLDVVIRARFDINFKINPFKKYKWEWDKVNFLWREPEHTYLPIVNDAFFTFPHFMIKDIMQTFLECELNPYKGVKVALHNIYQPLISKVGEKNVRWVDNEFKRAHDNDLYTLTRIVK